MYLYVLMYVYVCMYAWTSGLRQSLQEVSYLLQLLDHYNHTHIYLIAINNTYIEYIHTYTYSLRYICSYENTQTYTQTYIHQFTQYNCTTVTVIHTHAYIHIHTYHRPRSGPLHRRTPSAWCMISWWISHRALRPPHNALAGNKIYPTYIHTLTHDTDLWSITYIHTYIRISLCRYIHSCINTYIHSNIAIHTCTQT